MDHKADVQYKLLVGEVFSGKYIGTWNRGDEDSIDWMKISISKCSDEMRKILDEIEAKFEGKIWTGFLNNVLYAKYEGGCAVEEANKFEIIQFKNFPFPVGWKEPEKYTDKCGYNLILKGSYEEEK